MVAFINRNWANYGGRSLESTFLLFGGFLNPSGCSEQEPGMGKRRNVPGPTRGFRAPAVPRVPPSWDMSGDPMAAPGKRRERPQTSPGCSGSATGMAGATPGPPMLETAAGKRSRGSLAPRDTQGQPRQPLRARPAPHGPSRPRRGPMGGKRRTPRGPRSHRCGSGSHRSGPRRHGRFRGSRWQPRPRMAASSCGWRRMHAGRHPHRTCCCGGHG